MEIVQIPDFRRFSNEDHDGFADLVNAVHAEFGYSFDPDLDADLADPLAFYRHLWVARVGLAVVGSVALTAAVNGVTTLKRMYLRPEFRGQGWGRHMLDTAIETAAREGWKRIILDTGAHQHAAHRLYEFAGFELDRKDGTSMYYSKDLRGDTVSCWMDTTRGC
ncbi:GNAT family N-acetyltransferase [Pseudarthrobacter oxydans]|uniref:GNAT family N-acetyltransferase n=1 Tax=Pseudarthrobacter oxydans TaxID=1671 RepID=UPI003803F215